MLMWLLHCGSSSQEKAAGPRLLPPGTASFSSHIHGIQHGGCQGRGFPSLFQHPVCNHTSPHTDATPR